MYLRTANRSHPEQDKDYYLEIVSLESVKDALEVKHSFDDAFLTRLIKSAITLFEESTGVYLGTARLELGLDVTDHVKYAHNTSLETFSDKFFRDYSFDERLFFNLKVSRVESFDTTKVRYTLRSDEHKILNPDELTAWNEKNPFRIEREHNLRVSILWKDIFDREIDFSRQIQMDFMTAFEDSIPQDIRLCIERMVAKFYEYRDDSVDLSGDTAITSTILSHKLNYGL